VLKTDGMNKVIGIIGGLVAGFLILGIVGVFEAVFLASLNAAMPGLEGSWVVLLGVTLQILKLGAAIEGGRRAYKFIMWKFGKAAVPADAGK